MRDRIRTRRRRTEVASLFCLALLHPVSSFVAPRSRILSTNNRQSSGATFPLEAGTPSSHIAVSIDQSLLPNNVLFSRPGPKASRTSPALLMKSLLAALTSQNVVLVAGLALCTVLVVALVARSRLAVVSTVNSVVRSIADRIQSVIEGMGGSSVAQGVPMPFNERENEGWGVCTLRSKRRLGKSSFVRYDFDLPDPDYVLPLDLGQQISLCCLDSEDNVARGDFYPYSPDRVAKPGIFSILAPNRSPEENSFAVGQDAANFVRVLKSDLKVGDEIALKPGRTPLNYRGQYLPVTDMVYIAFGVGIVPVLEQARTILPNGSSSVKSVTVTWINERTKDFDVNSDLLEKEYNKFRNKMAVSCIVEDVSDIAMLDSAEINSAIPDFRQGTMAVVAGPKAFTDKTVQFLVDRGYPADTICVL